MGVRSPDLPTGDTTPHRGPKKPPRDLNCKLETGQGRSRTVRAGVAVLTDDELRFHTGRTGREGADFFVHLRYCDLAEVVVAAAGGVLELTTTEGERYRLHVGRYAAAWKELMAQPPRQLDLFGITARMRVAVDFMPDEELAAEIEACVPGAAAVPGDAVGLDALFVGVEHPADLKRFAEHARRIRRPDGALWVIYTPGPRRLAAEKILAAARAAGLHEAGVVVLSRDHEAIRFLADR
jgi:hypothetical protein